MSVYTTGAAAYRDTTRWLVAFVPSASLVAAGAVVGPRLVDAANADGFSGFVSSTWLPLAGVAAMIVGIWLIVGSGAEVLAAQPTDLAAALKPTQEGVTDPLTLAFADGLGAPYYFDVDPFRSDLRKLTSSDIDPDEAKAKRVLATVTLTREWALQRELSTAFESFRKKFAIGLAVTAVGFVVAAVTIDEPGNASTTPVRVTITGDTAIAEFNEVFGCSSTDATLWMVGGTWDQPQLQADGETCSPDETWQPAQGDVRIRPTD